MFEYSRDRFFIVDMVNSFSQYIGECQSMYFIQCFNFWCQWNGIVDDKFINDRVFDVLDSVVGEDWVCCVSEYVFCVMFFQCFCCFIQGVVGVDYIVDYYVVMIGNVVDDVYYLGDVGVRMVFVDDSYIGIIQQFSDSVGMYDVVDVWRNYNWVVQVQLQYIFQQDWVVEYVIDWYIEEVLDLFCVQVNGQYVVNVDVGQKICYYFCGDWYMSRMNMMVLMSIIEVRDNGGDMIC